MLPAAKLRFREMEQLQLRQLRKLLLMTAVLLRAAFLTRESSQQPMPVAVIHRHCPLRIALLVGALLVGALLVGALLVGTLLLVDARLVAHAFPVCSNPRGMQQGQ